MKVFDAALFVVAIFIMIDSYSKGHYYWTAAAMVAAVMVILSLLGIDEEKKEGKNARKKER